MLFNFFLQAFLFFFLFYLPWFSLIFYFLCLFLHLVSCIYFFILPFHCLPVYNLIHQLFSILSSLLPTCGFFFPSFLFFLLIHEHSISSSIITLLKFISISKFFSLDLLKLTNLVVVGWSAIFVYFFRFVYNPLILGYSLAIN